jgi:hypothetical protein
VACDRWCTTTPRPPGNRRYRVRCRAGNTSADRRVEDEAGSTRHDPSATASGAVASGAAMTDAGGHRPSTNSGPGPGAASGVRRGVGLSGPRHGPGQRPLEPEVGFEPTTCSLRVSCSAGLSYPGGRSSMARPSRMGGRRRSRSWSSRDSVGLRTMASAAAWMAATAEMAERASPVPVARASP